MTGWWRHIFSVAAILAMVSSTSAQTEDSIIIEPKQNKVKMIFAFDALNSWVLSRRVGFNGLLIGLELQEKHRFGLGYHGMRLPLLLPADVDQNEFPGSVDTTIFDFSYTSLFYSRVWFESKRWEISSPGHFGIGAFDLAYRDTSGRRGGVVETGASFVATLGGYAQFKIFRWFALGSGAGYRIPLTRDSEIRKALDGIYYQLQIKILIGELYKMTFKRSELEEW